MKVHVGSAPISYNVQAAEDSYREIQLRHKVTQVYIEFENSVVCLVCTTDEFKCLSSDECISGASRCDDVDDCPDGSDEFGCRMHAYFLQKH